MEESVFIRVNGYVLCPRCKIPMYYGSETVKDSSGTRITRFYQCPACRLKLVDERLTIVKANNNITIKAIIDRKTIITMKIERARRKF
jgi:hypothetical protein